MNTPHSSKSHQSIRKSKPISRSFNKSSSITSDTSVKHNLRTSQTNQSTPSRSLTKYGLWINEKNLTYCFYPISKDTPSIPNQSVKKNVKHHGHKQIWKKKSLHHSHMPTFVKNISLVTSGPKLVCVPKLTN